MSIAPDRGADLRESDRDLVTPRSRPEDGGVVKQCESKVGGVCARPAAWKQTIYAGQRDQGRVLMYSVWCDEHADRIVQKRRRESLAPPQMTPLVAEAS